MFISQNDKLLNDLLLIFNKLHNDSTYNSGKEGIEIIFKNNISNEKNMEFIFQQIINDTLNLKNLEKKKIIDIIPYIIKINPPKFFKYIDKILFLYKISINEETSKIFLIISKNLGEVTKNLFTNLKTIDTEALLAYKKILNFCISNMTSTIKTNQICGTLCLTSFIENYKYTHTDENIKIIWENLINQLDNKINYAKLEILNCLISLIYSVENKFCPYATKTLYKIIDYITEEEWLKRKLALNIVYTLLYYCDKEMQPLKEYILSFIKEKNNIEKVKEVKDVFKQVISLIEEKGITKLENSIDIISTYSNRSTNKHNQINLTKNNRCNSNFSNRVNKKMFINTTKGILHKKNFSISSYSSSRKYEFQGLSNSKTNNSYSKLNGDSMKEFSTVNNFDNHNVDKRKKILVSSPNTNGTKKINNNKEEIKVENKEKNLKYNSNILNKNTVSDFDNISNTVDLLNKEKKKNIVHVNALSGSKNKDKNQRLKNKTILSKFKDRIEKQKKESEMILNKMNLKKNASKMNFMKISNKKTGMNMNNSCIIPSKKYSIKNTIQKTSTDNILTKKESPLNNDSINSPLQKESTQNVLIDEQEINKNLISLSQRSSLLSNFLSPKSSTGIISKENQTTNINKSNSNLEQSKELIKQLESKIVFLEEEMNKLNQKSIIKINIKECIQKKDYNKALELAIEIKSCKQICYIIKNFQMNSYKKDNNVIFCENTLKKLLVIFCEDLLKYSNLNLIFLFIKQEICDKNIKFEGDRGFAKVVYENFSKVLLKKDELCLTKNEVENLIMISKYFCCI